MDPWSTSTDFLDDLASVMRNTILCAIGTVSTLHNISLFLLQLAIVQGRARAMLGSKYGDPFFANPKPNPESKCNH